MRSQQHLELNQKQQLALNQLQYQSLRLLQCSATEITVEIDKAIADNPLLEKIDISDINEQQKLDRYWLSMSNGLSIDDIPDSPTSTSLTDYLFEQLRMLNLPDSLKQLVLILISELDDRGYLDKDWAKLNNNLTITASTSEWEKALDILQSFDPIGVGARDLAESLRLQLLKQSFDVGSEVYQCAVDLTTCLPDVAAGRWQKLASTFVVDKYVLEQAYKLIQQLNPYPVSDWDVLPTNYIIPDVLIYMSNGVWQISLNPMLNNGVRVNQSLLIDINSIKTDQAQINPELQDKINQAKNFIRNLQQRGETIFRVANYLANYQTAYLQHGSAKLLPLKLNDVAHALDLHISTISRATRLKYAQTPLGLISLKSFFAKQIITGEASISPEAIKEKITELVMNENKITPLSDMALCKALENQGIKIARRTLSKYRESLGIGSSYLRKKD